MVTRMCFNILTIFFFFCKSQMIYHNASFCHVLLNSCILRAGMNQTNRFLSVFMLVPWFMSCGCSWHLFSARSSATPLCFIIPLLRSEAGPLLHPPSPTDETSRAPDKPAQHNPPVYRGTDAVSPSTLHRIIRIWLFIYASII